MVTCNCVSKYFFFLFQSEFGYSLEIVRKHIIYFFIYLFPLLMVSLIAPVTIQICVNNRKWLSKAFLT